MILKYNFVIVLHVMVFAKNGKEGVLKNFLPQNKVLIKMWALHVVNPI